NRRVLAWGPLSQRLVCLRGAPIEEGSSGMGEIRQGMVDTIAAMQDFALYRDLAWEGSFEEYLAIVRQHPQVTRNAFQRAFDMIIRYGIEEYTDNKKKLIRYNFFKDET